MKFYLLLLGAAFDQDTYPCEDSSDCRTSDVLAGLNDKYSDLGEITESTAVCMTIDGEN